MIQQESRPKVAITLVLRDPLSAKGGLWGRYVIGDDVDISVKKASGG